MTGINGDSRIANFSGKNARTVTCRRAALWWRKDDFLRIYGRHTRAADSGKRLIPCPGCCFARKKCCFGRRIGFFAVVEMTSSISLFCPCRALAFCLTSSAKKPAAKLPPRRILADLTMVISQGIFLLFSSLGERTGRVNAMVNACRG